MGKRANGGDGKVRVQSRKWASKMMVTGRLTERWGDGVERLSG